MLFPLHGSHMKGPHGNMSFDDESRKVTLAVF